MGCSCYLGFEMDYYTNAQDPALGFGKIIGEDLLQRTDYARKDGGRSLVLTFSPCPNYNTCPGSIRKITHHVSRDPENESRTLYIREEEVEVLSDYFAARGELPDELLVEDLKMKVNIFAQACEWTL